MDNLENILKNNREDFDTFEPKAGHAERFKNMLEDNKQSKNKRSFTLSLLKYAAVFALLFIGSFVTYKYFSNTTMYEKSYQAVVFSNLLPEYQEAELYFISQINSKYETINELNFQCNNKGKELLLSDLSQADILFTELQTDLNENPYDERIINAIINHYQIKLEILNQIINQLQIC